MKVRVSASFVMLWLVFGTVAVAQTSAPPAAPVAINACQPMINNNSGGPSVAGISLTGTSSGIQIQFTNNAAKTANLINFAVDSNGTSFVIRDVGTFSPGVEITHRYRNGSGQSFVLPSLIAPALKCSVESVHFTDGTIWRAGSPPTAVETPEPQLGPSGLLSAAPSRIDATAQGTTQYFMVSTREKIGGFSERDSCQGIANLTLVANDWDSATYSVQPVSRGSCTATITDQDGHSLSVPINVR
ncbi:MAG: hypothetical protein JO165_08790 [Candidatus Eremiobacteraeota bacterium]|nr:hypothetical protein [Candidatus Eremiobacteraeota bacterium]